MENIENYGKELADIFVTGSTCLKKDDLDGSLEKLMAFRNSLINEYETVKEGGSICQILQKDMI